MFLPIGPRPSKKGKIPKIPRSICQTHPHPMYVARGNKIEFLEGEAVSAAGWNLQSEEPQTAVGEPVSLSHVKWTMRKGVS